MDVEHDTEPHFAPEAAPSLCECMYERVNTLIALTIINAGQHIAGNCLHKFKSHWMSDLQRSALQGKMRGVHVKVKKRK